MSRILVIGVGTPGFLPARRHAGPGLRSAHLATAIARAGHDVLVLAVVAAHDGDIDMPPAEESAVAVGTVSIVVEAVREKHLFTEAIERRIAAFAPDAVVGVTVYAAALAARMKIDAPLWADVFGDIMAEAQAKAARSGSDWSIVHFWTLLRGVLESADRFSAVSTAQAHALIGQLGLAGRLSSRTAGEELVVTIPCASERSLPSGDPGACRARDDRERVRRELGARPDDFVLLLSGGVNTWCDIDTVAAGIARAMAAMPRLRVVVTGGGIPGHDEASHAALTAALGAIARRELAAPRKLAEGSQQNRRNVSAENGPVPVSSARIRNLGWIDSERLPGIYAASDLALHVERPLYERVLGAENRAVEWLAHGLPFLTTALSETTRDLAGRGIAFSCRPGDANDLAREIVRLAADPALLGEAARRGREWAEAERGYSCTAQPLVDWCAAPHGARDQGGARLVRLGLLSHPETSVELLEAYVAVLPARELARRGVRWIWRRAWSAATRLFRADREQVPISRAKPVPVADFEADGEASHAGDLRPRPGITQRSASIIVTLLLAANAIVAGGCDRGRPKGAAAHPNILLLSIDTLRVEHVGAYGYRATPSPTPSIDALAARGVVFEQAISSAPETAPALATLITGLYQDRHDVLFNRATLGEENVTLAERLKSAGYATRAFLANWLVDPKHGFGQGFDAVEMIPGGVPGYSSTDDRLVEAVGDFLREPPTEPWFAWVHMMDPHGPYNSASPWWSNDFDYANAKLARDGEFPDSDSNFGLGVIPAYQKLESAKTLSDYVRRYDGEIHFTDTQVGSILARLAASGMGDQTVVVLTADHGESLVEHDELLQHGWFAYDTTIRVPLVVAWPAGIAPARRVAAEVCSVDVVPTILDLAGAAGKQTEQKEDQKEMDGRSLAADLGLAGDESRAHGGAIREPGCFAIGPRANHPIALRTAKLKAIVTPAGAPTDPRAPKGERTSEPERVELYDLATDPAEADNVAKSRPEAAEPMLASIEQLRARFRANGWRW